MSFGLVFPTPRPVYVTLGTVNWQQYQWQNHLPAKRNKQTLTVCRQCGQLWPHLSCLAGWWFFFSAVWIIFLWDDTCFNCNLRGLMNYQVRPVVTKIYTIHTHWLQRKRKTWMTTKYENVPNPKFNAVEWHHFEQRKLCSGITLFICKNIQTK